MMNFSTYGMAGIGTAAAIGFVFALSFLSTNPSITDGGESQDLTQDPGSVPLSSELKQQDDESPPDERESETGENLMMQQGRAEFAIRDNSVNCEV